MEQTNRDEAIEALLNIPELSVSILTVELLQDQVDYQAAQLEMERRFNTIYGSDVKGKVYFSTLHSFCNSVVRDYERRQGKKLTRIEGDNPNGENEEVCENKRIIIRNI